MIKQNIERIFIVLYFVMFFGCVGPTVRTYTGDKLQRSAVAVVKGWYYVLPPFGYVRYYIYEVDDGLPKASKVEVLPGWHKLIIRKYVASLLPWGPVPGCVQAIRPAFNFEAGHEYGVKDLYEGVLTAGVKILDVTTGIVIFSQQGWGPCEPQPQVYFSACIQPLSQRQGAWSSEEVSLIREAITTVAQRHGLEQKETTERGYIAWYALPRKSDKDFDLKAHYTNPAVAGVSCGHVLNNKDQTGTIFVGLMYDSGGSIIANVERNEFESTWKEIYELLQTKFGERLTPLRTP